jgi:hypothetical protein
MVVDIEGRNSGATDVVGEESGLQTAQTAGDGAVRLERCVRRWRSCGRGELEKDGVVAEICFVEFLAVVMEQSKRKR